MASTTPNMGLIKWTAGTDPYDHSQLASNFQRVDEHDHTSGKGVRLKGASLENEAVDTTQLKDKSVTNSKLAGGITADKLASGVVDDLGDFKMWWRPNSSTPIPSGGWVVAAGQSLNSKEHEFAGGGTIILPNLLERFVYGVEIANIGQTGGSRTINLAHSHNVNPHSHTIGPHSHFLSLETGYNAQTNLKISQDLSGSSWVHADNANNVPHKHSINGSVETTGLTTDAASSSTDERLSNSQSIIPPWVGMLPLIKVKNS